MPALSFLGLASGCVRGVIPVLSPAAPVRGSGFLDRRESVHGGSTRTSLFAIVLKTRPPDRSRVISFGERWQTRIGCPASSICGRSCKAPSVGVGPFQGRSRTGMFALEPQGTDSRRSQKATDPGGRRCPDSQEKPGRSRPLLRAGKALQIAFSLTSTTDAPSANLRIASGTPIRVGPSVVH